MKPSQTIFNREHQAVTISVKEYMRLRRCEKHAKALSDILRGEDE